jgi:adenylyltransferase/sulfurtransferase
MPSVPLPPIAQPGPELDGADRGRFARHLSLSEVGIEGQRRLRAARVLVVGAGGLGSPALLYLAAAGFGTIGVVDDDAVSASNLQRQVVHGVDDVGRPKVDSAADAVARLDPRTEVVRHAERLTEANAFDLVSRYDVVVDGADNFATRYLVADACALAGRPHVWASVLRFDGQVTVWWPPHGPCYRCVFPEPPPEGSVASCAVAGVLGSVCAQLASIQATEAVKLVVGAGETLVGRLLVLDALTQRFGEVAVGRRPDCALCGDAPTITSVRGAGGSANAGEHLIAPGAAADWLGSAHPPLLVDVREEAERAVLAIEGSVHVPLGELPAFEPGEGRSVLVHCASGPRSARAVADLRARGVDAHDLAGGIIGWVDAGLPVVG